MGTLIKLAWRNIWRNSRRTIILICAVSIGLIGILLTIGFVNAWNDNMVEGVVNKYIGHIGIHAKGYFDNPKVELNFELTEKIKSVLASDQSITKWTPRIRVNGLMNNPEHSTMISIVGIDPAREADFSVVDDMMVEGRWLKSGDANSIVIGKKMLEKFKTKIGHKIVLMSQNLEGEVGSGAFRIVGVFKTDTEAFDKSVVYINLPDAQTMLGLQNKITGVGIRLANNDLVQPQANQIRSSLNDDSLEVLTWMQQEPFTKKTLDMTDQMMWLFYLIFFIAMAFGIVNTLLMAVNERYREIGIMLAIGIRRYQIVLMIALESFFISLVSLVVGNIISILVISYYHQAGIDLTSFAKGLEMWGIGHTLYLSISLSDIVEMSTWTFIIAVVFAMFPAAKAARFKPVEALRRI